jgi:hypothetical protein
MIFSRLIISDALSNIGVAVNRTIFTFEVFLTIVFRASFASMVSL